MSTSRRILAAHPFPGLYGSDRMLINALRALQADGASITVVVPEQGPLLSSLAESGFHVVVRPFPVLRKAMMRPTRTLRLALASPWHLVALWRTIRRERPDVVYVNTLTLPHWLIAARLARIPIVCHVREAEDQPAGALRALLLRAVVAPVGLANVVVANSVATRRWLELHAPRLGGRVRVVYNGFDFSALSTSAPDVAAAVKRRSRLVVVGRISPRKGQDVAVSAVAELVREGRDIELHLVGDVFRGYEGFERELRDQAARLGIEDRVLLSGFEPVPAVAYAAADIVLVPSRVEPFGNVAVEALAANRPVIASGVGGLPEIIDDRETGRLVPPDDVAALVAVIRELLDDPAEAARLAHAGALRVRERFGSEASAEGLRAAFDDAVGDPPRSGSPRPAR
ncbi:MAG: glycosyltransferase family 4 protein [Mycobacteriales bacterium]